MRSRAEYGRDRHDTSWPGVPPRTAVALGIDRAEQWCWPIVSVPRSASSAFVFVADRAGRWRSTRCSLRARPRCAQSVKNQSNARSKLSEKYWSWTGSRPCGPGFAAAAVRPGALLRQQKWRMKLITRLHVAASCRRPRRGQKSSSKNSISRRAKKPRSSPWSWKDEDSSHKWRQTKSRHNSNAEICNKAVDYEFYNTDGITAELHGRIAKTASVGNTIRQIPSSTIIFGVENSIQNPSDYLFWLSVRSYVVDQRSGDGWFFGWAKTLMIRKWKRYSKLWDAGREECLGSDQDRPEFQIQEEGQPRGTESSEGGPVSTSETIRLHDLRLLSSNWCSWRSIALCWFILCHSSRWQHSEIRYEMGRNFIIDDKNSSDEILESLYKLRICESDQLKNVLELYDMEIHQKISVPNYQKLTTMVKRWIDQKLRLRNTLKRRKDQKLRLRNFDARHGRINSGAVVKSRKGIIDFQGGKGICYQWEEKGQCSKGDQWSFGHESNDRAQKPDHNATPPEPYLSRGRSVSKTRSVQGKSNHGATCRQPFRYYLKGTCTRSPCDYWHPPECPFFWTKNGLCKSGDTPKKGYFPKKRESEDKGAVAIVKSVSQLGCVSQDSDALASQGTNEFRGNHLHHRSQHRLTEIQYRRTEVRNSSIRKKWLYEWRASGRPVAWIHRNRKPKKKRISKANGKVQTRKEATEHVKELDLFVTVVFLEETPTVLSFGKLCEDHGYTYHWTSSLKPNLTKKGKRIYCSFSNYEPFVVLGITVSSSSTTPSSASSSFSSQDSVFDVNRYTENPVSERSGSTSEELRGDPLHESTDTEKQK